MSAEARRDVFQAIADPTRREIIRLVAPGALNLNAIADHFEISRPAISNHIKILSECGLVVLRRQGRERYCEARLETLKEVATWVGEYRQFWTKNFDSLEKYLDNIQNKSE